MRREIPVTFLSRGQKISGIIELPDKPTNKAVIFAHGLSNSKSPADIPLLYAINNAIVAEGFATMRFDFFGSGESDGEFCDKTISAMRDNFLDAFTFLKTSYPELQWVGAVGKSIGGTVLALVGNDRCMSACVLMTMRYTLAPFFAKFWHGQEQVSLSGAVPPTGQVKGAFSLRKAFFAELAAIDAAVANGLAQIPRTLVIMNEGDEKISVESGLEVYNHTGGDKQLITVPGHDHELRAAEESVVKSIVQFFKLSS